MGSSRILVIEDEPDVCASLQSFLGRRGHEVSSTGSGEEALQLAGSFKPDLVLLDMTLNDSNGMDVLRSLRKMNLTAKVIILTGQRLDEKRSVEAVDLSVVEVLQKPVSLADLDQLLLQHLGVPGERKPELPKVVAAVDLGGAAVLDFHKVANLLGMIRMACEGYVIESDEGLRRNKAAEEVDQEAKTVMRQVIDKVDAIAVRLDQARKSQ